MHTVKIKEQTDDTVTITGYGVVFGGSDLDGETFTADTKYYLDNYQTAPMFYDHKQGALKHAIGSVKSITQDEIGLFVEAELDKSADYVDGVLKLIDKGVVGMSSGTLSHIAERKNTTITEWPLGEVSLTVIPAEPRTISNVVIKQLAGDASLKALIPEAWFKHAENEATAKTPAVEVLQTDSTNGEQTMSDETKAVQDNEWRERHDKQVKANTDQLNKLIKLLEESPANKKAMSQRKGGVTKYTPTKSLGDASIALRKGEWDYLKSVYSFNKTTMVEGTGTLGGFTIPEGWLPGVYDMGSMSNQIVNLCNTINNSAPYGKMPVLDVYDAPATGQTAFAGGLVTTVVGEDSAFTETNLNFEQVTWELVKNGGVVSISNELLADTPEALESMIRRKIELAVTSQNQYWVLRGSGAGEPLGILNSGAAIAVAVDTDNTFAYADALEMTTRFKSLGGTPVWIIHPSVMAEIGVFESSAGGGVWQANYQTGLGNTLLGHQIIVSEYMPPAGGDRVILADLSAYQRWTRGGIMLAVSEHAEFTTDNIVYRFKERVDGRPLLRQPITISDGAGTYTMSPFVYLND
jgi:HK97 family phage major capsid protein/HK97 family phage prohead protease